MRQIGKFEDMNHLTGVFTQDPATCPILGLPPLGVVVVQLKVTFHLFSNFQLEKIWEKVTFDQKALCHMALLLEHYKPMCITKKACNPTCGPPCIKPLSNAWKRKTLANFSRRCK